jgi:hypothetical protein
VDGDTFSIGKTDFTFKATMNRFTPEKPSSATPREASRIEVPDPAEMIEAPPEPGKR